MKHELRRRPPGERRKPLAAEDGAAAEDVGGDADHGAGVEQRADPGLHVVPEECSKKLASGIAETFRRPQLDGAIGVLEVARGGGCPEVHPPTEVGVTDESCMSLVGVTQHDGVAYLASHLAGITNRA